MPSAEPHTSVCIRRGSKSLERKPRPSGHEPLAGCLSGCVMDFEGGDRRSGLDRRIHQEIRFPERRMQDRRSSVPDEFYFESADAALRRFPDQLWVAKGKPRLWVRLYENEGITVWRDLGFGLIRLVTPDGVGEGREMVSVKGVYAVCRDRKIEVYMEEAATRSAPGVGADEGISPTEDTLELEVEAEVILDDITEEGPPET